MVARTSHLLIRSKPPSNSTSFSCIHSQLTRPPTIFGPERREPLMLTSRKKPIKTKTLPLLPKHPLRKHPGVLRVFTCHVFSIVLGFFQVEEAPRGLLRASTCHISISQKGCLRNGGYLSPLGSCPPLFLIAELASYKIGLPRIHAGFAGANFRVVRQEA